MSRFDAKDNRDYRRTIALSYAATYFLKKYENKKEYKKRVKQQSKILQEAWKNKPNTSSLPCNSIDGSILHQQAK